MNSKKKLLSFITAVAISASAFTGLIVPANAANTDNDPAIELFSAGDTTFAVTAETSIAANTTYTDDDNLTVKTNFGTTLKDGATIGEVQYAKAIQVRSAAFPPNHTEQSGSTALLITAKKAGTLKYVYRRQAAETKVDNVVTAAKYEAGDGKDLQLYEMTSDTTAEKKVGTMTIDHYDTSQQYDNLDPVVYKYAFAVQTVKLEAGKNYVLTAKGTTICLYGYTFEPEVTASAAPSNEPASPSAAPEESAAPSNEPASPSAAPEVSAAPTNEPANPSAAPEVSAAPTNEPANPSAAPEVSAAPEESAAPAESAAPEVSAAPAESTAPAESAAPEASNAPAASIAPSTAPTAAPTPVPIDPKAVIDFTNRSLTAEHKYSATIFEVKDAADAGAAALAAAGAGNVLQIGSSQSAAAKGVGYVAPLAKDANGVVEYSGLVNLSFKLEPMQVRTDKEAQTEVQFADVTKTAILPMTVGTGATSNIVVNGSTVATEYGKYYVITETLDFDNNKAAIKIEDASGKSIYEAADIAITATNLAYMYYPDTEWRYGSCAVDDIKIDAETIGTPVYYTATINTTRYAKMTTSTGKTYYADVNGLMKVELLKPGATFDYTLSKVGYKDVTGKIENLAGDITEDKPMELADDKVLFIESEFGNDNGAYVSAGGSRNDEFSIGSFELPRMSEVAVNFSFAGFGNNSGQQKTWDFESDGGKLVGLQINDEGLFAWTGWTGTANMNQSSDIGTYSQSVRLGDVPSGDFDVKFVINKDDKAITVSYGDVSGSLTYDMEATAITGMKTGLYRYNGELKTNEIKVTEPDPMYMAIIGLGEFAKISGKTVTNQYDKTQAVITKDETFEWTATRDGADIEIKKNGAKLTLTKAPEENTTAVAVKATYTEDGTLATVKSDEVVLAAGQTEYVLDEETAGIKVMLWNSLNDMEPIAEAAVTGEYTEVVKGTTDMTGITIDKETGVLSIADTVVPGPVKVTCTGSTGKTASKDVVIDDFATVVPVVEGPNAYEAGQTGTYKVTSLVDELGANVIDFFTPSFASEDTSVITIDAATGVATAVAAGSTNIVVTIGNEGKKAEVKIPVTVGVFSVTADANGNSTEVSVADIAADSAISGYQVTTAAADGAKVNQTVVALADVKDGKITADTTGAAKVEVAPVYDGKLNTKYLVPNGTYNVVATAGNGRRADLYVNDQMLINNINQGSDNWTLGKDAEGNNLGSGRTIEASSTYTANDVVISEGYANFNLRDDQSSGSLVTGVQFVKAPSIVTRAKRVYVIGDSLVAKYYGTPLEGYEGLVRTGWGDVLQNYITGAEVTNLGNSGAWATGMYNDAFTSVQKSAKPGDIVIWESGYNDRNHGGADPMKEAMTKAAEECKALGVTLFFVTPNASSHDYKEDVVLAADVRTLAESLDNVTLIDLSKESYAFLNSRYGNDENTHAILQKYYNNTGDTLHSSYNAANCWAAIVASGLYANDATKAIVNTTYEYKFNDGTNEVVAKVVTE